jgi:hypothetical protein
MGLRSDRGSSISRMPRTGWLEKNAVETGKGLLTLHRRTRQVNWSLAATVQPTVRNLPSPTPASEQADITHRNIESLDIMLRDKNFDFLPRSVVFGASILRCVIRCPVRLLNAIPLGENLHCSPFRIDRGRATVCDFGSRRDGIRKAIVLYHLLSLGQNDHHQRVNESGIGPDSTQW